MLERLGFCTVEKKGKGRRRRWERRRRRSFDKKLYPAAFLLHIQHHLTPLCTFGIAVFPRRFSIFFGSIPSEASLGLLSSEICRERRSIGLQLILILYAADVNPARMGTGERAAFPPAGSESANLIHPGRAGIIASVIVFPFPKG